MANRTVQLLDFAVERLARGISCHIEARDHVITVSGLESSDMLPLVGIHIAGQMVNAVQRDLEIVADFLPQGTDDWPYIERDVERLLGDPEVPNKRFNETRRNPWLAEALAHLLLHLTRFGIDIGLPGQVWAVTPVTPSVTRQGLDMVALFEDTSGPGCYVAEVKASEHNIKSHIDAIFDLFQEILSGRRAFDLRTSVQSLAPYVPEQYRSALGTMIWTRPPTFAPILNHGTPSSFDAIVEAREFRSRLSSSTHRIIIKVIPVSSYGQFFNDVSNAVRSAVSQFKGSGDVQ